LSHGVRKKTHFYRNKKEIPISEEGVVGAGSTVAYISAFVGQSVQNFCAGKHCELEIAKN
jgi:hypothetical protein